MAMTPSSSSRRVVGDRGETGDRSAGGPVVAGATTVLEPALSAERLDMVGMLARAHDPAAGAVVLFSGEVRDNNRGKAVSCLEYEAHGPLAEKVIAKILATAREKWALHIAVARHRVGKVGVGETAVVVITASAHRAAAYAANQYIIDRIKKEAPIWKCEHYADGEREWVTPPANFLPG
jgi:molybdopterin synthase catalytic subunit